MESYPNPGHWGNQTKGLCFDLLKGSAILFSATSFLFQRPFLPVIFTCDVRPLCLLFCFCYGRGESSLWLASEAHFDERVVKSSGRSMDFEKIPQHSLLEFSWCVSDLFQTHDLEIAAKLGSDRDFMQTLKSKAWDLLLYKLWLSLSSSCMTFTGHCFMSFKYGKQCLAYLTYSINYWSLELSGKWNWLSPI